MHRPRRRVSVDALREATRGAVERSSLRKVARDIGISAPGLALFLDGSVPRETTLHKIREWYFSEAATRSQLSEETARAVLQMLLEPLPEERRRKVFRKIVTVMLEAHLRQGTVPPEWLRALDAGGDGPEKPDAGSG